MPVTYEPIATFTLSSNQTGLSFTSIPASYTDLRLVVNVLSTGPSNLWVRFNNDASSNYGDVRTIGQSGTAVSTNTINGDVIQTGYWGVNSTWFAATFEINNYTNTNIQKNCLWRLDSPYGLSSTANTEVILGIGNWNNTSAITQINLVQANQPFAAGSTFTLFGILAA
jgi:hypothetical protein